MTSFTNISIIYNPNSTGPGKTMAKNLLKELRNSISSTPIELLATEHAGHGEELAYDLAKANARALVISVSGDGGYSEVVNGLMRAQDEGARPTSGLLPAGNANNHFKELHTKDLVNRIQKNQAKHIDLLRLKSMSEGQPLSRVAHSYIGLGLTPYVGEQLNEVKLNWWKERVIAVKGIFSSPPVKILHEGSQLSFENLVFSNIGKMSKFLVLSKNYSVSDGKFEVTSMPRKSKGALLISLIRSTAGVIAEPSHVARYNFFTRHATSVQIDGEVYKLDADSKVKITIEPKKLRCIV